MQLYIRLFACVCVFFSHYPLVEPPPGASGKIMNVGSKKCIDGKFGGSGSPVSLGDCYARGAEIVSFFLKNEC